MYSPPRRRRRGVWLLAVLSVAVVVVVLVTSLRSERRVLAGYLDTARESTAAAGSSSGEFLDLADRIDLVDRQEFITAMARIRATSGAAGILLDSADVPGDALAAHARLQLALTSWLLGLELVEGAALAAADDPSDDLPADLIERAIVELAVGDRAYEAGVEALLALEAGADVDVPIFPVVVFTPAAGAEGMVAAIRTASGLVLRRDLAVSAVGFEPRTLGSTDAGVGILPFTDRLIVNVTVTNQGNETAGEIPLQVLLSSDRTGTSRSESSTVERLLPTEATSVEFVFEVVPVVNYELVINLGPATGETDLENNLLIVPFVVNQEG
jgi:hypothetical protein